MDAARLRRYHDKLDHARKRLDQAAVWATGAQEVERLAAYKAFQEAAEAAADLVAMALKDSGRHPRDDYRNLGIAAEAGVFPPGLVEALEAVTGLRNRLVHEYNGLDDEQAVESVDSSSLR